MINDRELLEFVAQSAGIEYQRTDDGEVIEYWGGGLQLAFNGGKWNPLTDDGDALRLAVHLKIELHFYDGEIDAVVNDDSGTDHSLATEFYETDPYTASRRAIVRAAAEISRAMQ